MRRKTLKNVRFTPPTAKPSQCTFKFVDVLKGMCFFVGNKLDIDLWEVIPATTGAI
jgi:hypothetical protein